MSHVTNHETVACRESVPNVAAGDRPGRALTV